MVVALASVIVFVAFLSPRLPWRYPIWYAVFVGLPTGYAVVLAIRGVRRAARPSTVVWGVLALLVAVGCIAILAGPWLEVLLR